MRTFQVTFVNQPHRNVKFKVQGICKYDALNPCWDGRKDDTPGKHWGGGPACAACTKAAFKAEAV